MPVLTPSPTLGLNQALTIGDIILTTRSLIPDVPGVLAPPAGEITVGLAASGGVTLNPGNYYVKVTYLNLWGETLPSSEFGPFAVDATHGLQVSIGAGLVPPPGVAAIVAYFGPAQGGENQQQVSTQYPFIITSPGNAAYPPVQSSAFLPDSNGKLFSAYTLYRWFNQGLEKLSRAVGGLLDYCGVPTVAGQPLYTMPGQWLEITDLWYGGYWIQGGRRGDFFRRNAITSDVLSNAAVSIYTDKQVLEIFYQPDRDSGITATNVDMSSTDTFVTVDNSGAFLLDFGFAQIGTEIVAYSTLSGGALNGLIRGIGNTTAQAWPSGTTVTELSLFWCGKRVFTTPYFPGAASQRLPAPSGWDTILTEYMLAQAKKGEQDVETAERMEKNAFDMAKEWMQSNRGIAQRFVQVGESRSSLLVYDQTIAGGLIVK